MSKEALSAKLAQESKEAREKRSLKTRCASAWLVARTMMPNAPENEQYKLAKNLLSNTTPALKHMLRQASVNALAAKQAAEMHKEEMNDLQEDPSVLRSEKAKVTSELKGDVKNAAAADNELPAEYPEPKRNEPDELDGSHAAERDPSSIDKTTSEKKAATKKACEGKKCDHKDCDKKEKEASAKKADFPEDMPAAEAPAADAPAEDAPMGDVPAEGEDMPAEDEGEEFDPEKADLEAAIADIESANDMITEKIDDIKGDEFDMDDLGETDVETVDEINGGEGDDMFAGEEFDVTQAFDPNTIEDKVSSLSGENVEAAFGGDEFDMEAAEEDGDEFFGPTDPAEMEHLLEQEEELMSPGDIFMPSADVHDPLEMLLSGKHASEADDVVAPGDLVDEFETDLSGDDRDAETDHDDTVFGELLTKLKPGKYDGERTKQDQEPQLKDPKTARTASIRKLKPIMASNKTESLDIAAALFRNDF